MAGVVVSSVLGQVGAPDPKTTKTCGPYWLPGSGTDIFYLPEFECGIFDVCLAVKVTNSSGIIVGYYGACGNPPA